MEASIGNHLTVAKHLLQFGCHINVMDKHGYTALSDAVCSGHLSMVDVLLKGIAIKDRTEASASLFICPSRERFNSIFAFLAGADVNIQDSRGRSALHISILYGYNVIAGRLLNSSPNINLRVRFAPCRYYSQNT